MKSLIFFERLLGVSAPYSITKIEQDQANEKGVHIYVEVSKERVARGYKRFEQYI